MRGNTDKLDPNTIENFYSVRESVKRMEAQARNRKYLQTTHATKDQYPECIENSQNSMVKQQTTQLENGPKTWTDISPKRIYKWQLST